MADYLLGIALGYQDPRLVRGGRKITDTVVDSPSAEYALTGIDLTALLTVDYTEDRIRSMTYNDILYAVRLITEP